MAPAPPQFQTAPAYAGREEWVRHPHFKVSENLQFAPFTFTLYNAKIQKMARMYERAEKGCLLW